MVNSAELLVLPGREPSTSAEMAELVRLAGLDAPVTAYSFWTGDLRNPDLTEEVASFAQKKPPLVLAKSIGVLIAMLALRQHGFAARAALFVGVPLKRLRHEGRIDLLLDYCCHTPTTILQRRDDPTGPFAELAQSLAPSAQTVLRELPGDTHSYADREVASVVQCWWRRVAAPVE